MDLKRLEYFVTIAEEGSISAAAKKLHISQPPLSQQLKLLENELGVRLLERGARRITLTEAGVILYKRAQRILELSEQTVKEIEDLGQKLNGTLRLGTTSSSGPALLSRRIAEFSHSCPNVRYEIHEGNTFELLELLSGGIIEIAIARTPFHAENTSSYALEVEPLTAVGKESYFSGFTQQSIALEYLRDKPLILYRRFEKIIFSACKTAGFKPNVFCKNDDARTSLMWAEAGLGIAIIPKSMEMYFQGHSMTSKVISEPKIESGVVIVWQSDRLLSPTAKAFLDYFTK